jgi:hypothetical protein
MKTLASDSKKRKGGSKPKRDDDAQSHAFREAAREAGVDPDADIDEVMRRLAGQTRAKKKPD